jgi:hypothetical protein
MTSVARSRIDGKTERALAALKFTAISTGGEW